MVEDLQLIWEYKNIMGEYVEIFENDVLNNRKECWLYYVLIKSPNMFFFFLNIKTEMQRKMCLVLKPENVVQISTKTESTRRAQTNVDFFYFILNSSSIGGSTCNILMYLYHLSLRG